MPFHLALGLRPPPPMSVFRLLAPQVSILLQPTNTTHLPFLRASRAAWTLLSPGLLQGAASPGHRFRRSSAAIAWPCTAGARP